MVAILAVGFVATIVLKQVDSTFHVPRAGGIVMAGIGKALSAGCKASPLAMVLWFIVLIGLGFGVAQTALKATALFTG